MTIEELFADYDARIKAGGVVAQPFDYFRAGYLSGGYEESKKARIARRQATQFLITLGKYVDGYRPGDEGWTAEDQEALDLAMGKPEGDMTTPTPPVSVPNSVPLDTLITELDADPKMKAAMDEARKTVTLDGCTVTDFPTPPEVEPDAWSLTNEFGGILIWSHQKELIEHYRNKYPNAQYVALFVRPAPSDNLRKAVQWHVEYIENGGSLEAAHKKNFRNLKAALEGKT